MCIRDSYWAYTGTGTMEGKEPAKDLRTIAALFQEHIHLVALKKSSINSVKDLKGKRVSLDEPGSGTYVDAKLILESNGLSTSDVKAEALKGKAATDALRNGKVDAIFVVAGYPTGAIVELASAVGHAKGKTITPDTALSGVGVPLHPGAEKFYKEAGLLN